MRRAADLEARLTEWAHEYGGGRYEQVGWRGISPLAQLMRYHGRSPEGLKQNWLATNSAADEVDRAVNMLDAQKGGHVPAAVLRCEYFSGNVARDVRLQRLARIGHRMETSRYSHHLRSAKIHVAAWLHLPFDEPLRDNDSVAMLEYLVSGEDVAMQ